MTNYIDNQIAHDLITDQFQLFKAFETDREARLRFADNLIEQFYAQHGEVRLFNVGFQQFMHNKSKKKDAKKLNRVFSHPLFLLQALN